MRQAILITVFVITLLIGIFAYCVPEEKRAQVISKIEKGDFRGLTDIQSDQMKDQLERQREKTQDQKSQNQRHLDDLKQRMQDLHDMQSRRIGSI